MHTTTMLLAYAPHPFTYGPYSEDEPLDSDSDLTPVCGCCEGAVDENGLCEDCEEVL